MANAQKSDKITALLRKGLSPVKVAEKLGTTPQYVYLIRKQMKGASGKAPLKITPKPLHPRPKAKASAQAAKPEPTIKLAIAHFKAGMKALEGAAARAGK